MTEHDRNAEQKESGGFFGGLGNKVRPRRHRPRVDGPSDRCAPMVQLNEMAGGGTAGEAKEDKLDKSIDWVQEHLLGQGQQSNESATEQLKDEQISDFVRRQYKSVTGHDFPVADKS
ncbi:hypothetical protein C8T65DRAFT_654113 [Cerioporus squamosus]|nr:hypothetical protein C8T65DRAFT_654113 [Cerioporus squamosus]